MPTRLLPIALALLLAGCGGERTFEPQEFVEEANAEGAGLVLGEPLTSITEGVDVYAVSFEETSGSAAEPGGDEHGHEGGSMIVTEDAESATGEFERCDDAVSLTCYRAANVVLYFNAPPTDEQLVPVEAAIRALASE